MIEIWSSQILVDYKNWVWAGCWYNHIDIRTDPVCVTKVDDMYYLMDGHHRVIHAIKYQLPLEAILQVAGPLTLDYMTLCKFVPIAEHPPIPITIKEVQEYAILTKHY